MRLRNSHCRCGLKKYRQFVGTFLVAGPRHGDAPYTVDHDIKMCPRCDAQPEVWDADDCPTAPLELPKELEQ